jgi:hypothetical protein
MDKLRRTFILRAISEHKLTAPLLLTILVQPLVPSTIWPRFNAATFLLIIDPVTNVLGAVYMEVLTLTICLIVSPITLVEVAICMEQSSLAATTIVDPLPFISAFTKIPYIEPSGQIYFPTPSRMPSNHSPSYTAPLSRVIYPNLVRTLQDLKSGKSSRGVSRPVNCPGSGFKLKSTDLAD